MSAPEMAAADRPCHGCAHSASGAPFPGHPSGERPCMFCERNPEGGLWEKGVWYDGKTPAIKTPMDCYIATDRLQQQRAFDALDRIERGEQTVNERGDGWSFMRACGATDDELTERAAAGDPAPPCCAGGPVNGHALTCIEVVGIGFG